MFYWFEPVLYLDPVSKFPETTERPGYFVGFADNVGDALTFKILKNDLVTVLMNTKSQIDFDRLLKLHMLNQTEEDNDISWECHKVVDYCKEKGDVNNSNHKCLVEWNDVNKTKSWVNYFALSLSNPKPIISFARNNNLLDKMPFLSPHSVL
jgi:hypothetical protein